ncbi:MAG: ABC-type transporter, ATPase subunit [Chlamydiales bacterium]|jgi:zinc transport system ATP-binding protein|nr:ABC-type transporter, ATPase subunit [Chlamydiales bacterium]
MDNQEPAISFQEVNFSYYDTPVLMDVSFDIQPGAFVGLIGPNGGGKSTLLKLIMGFLEPQQGALSLFGQSPLKKASCIGYVPQALQFDRQFPISALEVVLEGCLSAHRLWPRHRAIDRKKALQALSQVGLESFYDAPFGSLSGGQAQRVLIARALASDPEILLLDEPTAMVDSQAELDIYAILKGLKGKMTILMVTHDLNAIVTQVEKVLCAQKRVVALRPEEVCAHFAVGLYHIPLINSPEKERP